MIELPYTPKEKHDIKTLEKQLNIIDRKKMHLKDKLAMLQSDENHLDLKLKKIRRVVIDRMMRKCKHDVVGPYECARDDCSGGHYRCRICGKSEFHHFGNDKR